MYTIYLGFLMLKHLSSDLHTYSFYFFNSSVIIYDKWRLVIKYLFNCEIDCFTDPVCFPVPDTVWRLNIDVPEEARDVRLDNTEDRWWEQAELTKLILASNLLTEISEDISNFAALTVLDVSMISHTFVIYMYSQDFKRSNFSKKYSLL